MTSPLLSWGYGHTKTIGTPVLLLMAGCDVVNDSARIRREADLAAYYDAEVHERADRPMAPGRVAQRDAFLMQLQAEGSSLCLRSAPGRVAMAKRLLLVG